MMVTAAHMHKRPAVCLEFCNDVAAVHGVIIHTLHTASMPCMIRQIWARHPRWQVRVLVFVWGCLGGEVVGGVGEVVILMGMRI